MSAGALQFLKALVPLVRRLGPRANPGVLKDVPLKAYAVWALYAGEPSPMRLCSTLARGSIGLPNLIEPRAGKGLYKGSHLQPEIVDLLMLPSYL